MSAEIATLKRAYEFGRARVAMSRALVASMVVTVVSAATMGRGAIAWSLVAFSALAFIEWRGGPLARGGWRGFVVGLVTLVLPSSLLRPCCDAMSMSGDAFTRACCTMPSMCGVAGVVLGLGMALVWPREKSSRDHALAGVGIAIGAMSVAASRCTGLFLGEALGLAGGLLAGVAASAMARAWLGSRVSA